MAKGIMTNIELIDSIIEDVNNGLKQMLIGNYVGWSAVNVQIVQKLTNLKKGVSDDIASREEIIADLKRHLRQCDVEVVDRPAEIKMDGENNDKD